MEFEYYYGNQAEQFSFIKIPKLMITDKAFSELSLPAKVLYGLLLDRMSLSMKNRWFDSENRVYIIYQIADIQEDLGISKNKAIDLLNALEKFGLVEKKRRGLGMPSLLYVKNFIVEKNCSPKGFEEKEKKNNARGRKLQTLEIPQKATSEGTEKGTLGSMEKATSRNTKIQIARSIENLTARDRDNIISGSIINSTSRSSEKTTSRSPEKATSGSLEMGLQEVAKSEPPISKTNCNHTYVSQSTSNQIQSCDGIGCEDSLRQYGQYEMLIRKNIEYDILLQMHSDNEALIQGILQLIMEVVMCKGEEIVIAKNTYPVEVVRSRFLKLDYSHIEYVIFCLQKNTTKVKNIKKYMMAALFNAPVTIESYYQAEVNHDFPQYIS